MGLLIPINYDLVAAVSLKAACFSTNQYADVSFQKCFSNLLAIGLRRFVIDVYWDNQRSIWSLCPAEIPPPSAVPSPTISASSVTSTSSASSSVSSPLNSSTTDSSFSSPSPSSSTLPPTQDDQSGGTGGLYHLGAYNCSSTMIFGYLTGILADFLQETSTTTDASFTYLLLNVQAASSWAAPNDPAQQPPTDRLPPSVGVTLSDLLKGNLSDALYTPSKLADQRANLNDSWYDVADDTLPAAGYYRVEQGSEGDISTSDGWPNEAYVQFSQYFRLIAAIGTVAPQMSVYNFSDETIFESGTIRFQNVSFSPSGAISSGCLFDESLTTITPTTNSSLALAAVPSSVQVPTNPDLSTIIIPAASNLTACGLSPFLNHTLANTTADENPLPYAAFTHSYLWSWAPGEPLNATDPSSSTSTSNRCTAIYSSGPYSGRWHVADCASQLRVACQNPSEPYSWAVSDEAATYGDAPNVCKSPRSFSVPHTALENTHLHAAIAAASLPAADSVFIDLNSLDVPDCWVAQLNASCPYQSPGDTNETRIVVVPTVAAVLIFVCAALTFFVKCAANRRDERRGRRRRVVEGWEYEGVPS